MQKRAVQFAKKSYLPLFSSETADKFARDYTIEKSFRHALHLVTAYLHRQNQVAHALCTRDFWLEKLSIHFPIHSTRRVHEYPVTLMALLKLPFFKANHPSTEKPRALVGFEHRTEPELSTRDSHSTSTPHPTKVSGGITAKIQGSPPPPLLKMKPLDNIAQEMPLQYRKLI